MTRLAAFLFVIFGLTALSFAQSEDIKPKLSKNPLTAEQLAVYQTFLRFYTNDSDNVLYVADTTEWLDISDVKHDADCSQSFGQMEFDSPKQTDPTIHTLDHNLAVDGHIALVDSAGQSEKVKQNDPSKTMREGKSVDRAVNDAFASGLLTLSEIVFDKDHGKAVMSYSFFCGKLCGNGAVVLLKRVGRKWRVTKQSCGEWVS
jgi:hypothetical protein